MIINMNFDFSLKPQKDVVKDMIFDDDSDQDSKIPYEVPQEVRKLTTQAYDKSVADVVRMIEDKEIRIIKEIMYGIIKNHLF